MDRYQKVTMKSCPKCGGQHTFSLKVRRITVLTSLEPGSILNDEDSLEATSVKIVRDFTCPVTHEEFRAGFRLPQLPNSEIQSVDVLGVA